MLSLAIMMFPFVMPWYDASPSFTNLSGHLHRPAGAYGFITGKEGHLFAGDRRIRFVGMNFSFGANLPTSKRDAEVIAARLAKYGINCVRMTHLDGKPTPEGILKPDMKTLDPVAMDRLDYFVSQLKKNGIYVLLGLHVGREYPGLEHVSGQQPLHDNGIDNYYEAAIVPQKEYAKDLLKHFNPYTGMDYSNDPVIAAVEINNENALSMRWWDGALDKAPNVYLDDLTSKWNTWLTARYSSNKMLARAWRNDGIGPDLLVNGSFSRNLDGWYLMQSHGSVAALTFTADGPNERSPASRLEIKHVGKKAYDVQLYQEGINIDPNSTYTLRFEAKADRTRRIGVGLLDPKPYRHLDGGSVSLSEKWEKYSITMTPGITSATSRLAFANLDPTPGAVWISNISLRPGGAVGLPQGEQLGRISYIRRTAFLSHIKQVQEDWLSFLADTEDRYWSEMYRYLRSDLKLRSLIIGTQQSYSPYFIQQKMDIIDMHGYWDTQSKLDHQTYLMKNRPQVGDPYGGVMGPIAARRISGKPFIVSEYNYRGANTYASEADLLMLAYASLQDWDGVFIFNYANIRYFNADRIIGDEGFNGHSNRFVSLVPAALMFHRGDVRPSKTPFTLSVTKRDLVNKMRLAGPAPGTYDFGLDFKQALKTGISFKIVEQSRDASTNLPAPVRNDAPIISDTGELMWDPGAGDGKGMFTINTDRTKAIIGFAKGRAYDLGGVIIEPGKTIQNWAAISMTALDDAGSLLSGNVLLTATGNSENTGMMFSADRTHYTWGSRPVLVEGIQASIVLPVAVTDVRVWALDETGNPKDQVPVIDLGGKSLIKIDSRYKTIWYKIEIRAP